VSCGGFRPGLDLPVAARETPRRLSGLAAVPAAVRGRYGALPAHVRPALEDLPAFAKSFSTYLTNTFDLEAAPGERLHAYRGHCFCPCCSWMVRVPHLTPKSVGPRDKRRAARMERDFLAALAREEGVAAPDATLDALLADPSLREARALCAYAVDLLRRLQGVAEGPASLALWRGFAWTAQGSPKHGFTLTVDAILRAEAVLKERLRAG
jgi:hypothetical protein